MDNNKLKFTRLEQEIFSLLSNRSGEKLSQREIAKLLHVSPTAVSKSVKGLIREKIVKIEKIKNINFISFNRDNEKAIELKRIENLKQLYLSGLSDYLLNNLPGATVILFGSYSKGEDIFNSDIDIAVIEKKEKTLELDKYEKLLNRNIHILWFNSWKKINKHLLNNILNGIVLHGSVQL